MKQRREAIDLAREIFFFIKKNEGREYSINQISKEFRAKFEITIKCLDFLKSLELIKERAGSKKPIPERFFSLNK